MYTHSHIYIYIYIYIYLYLHTHTHIYEPVASTYSPTLNTPFPVQNRALPPPQQPSRGPAHAGDDSVWHPIEDVIYSSADESYPPERIGAPIGDDEESAAAAYAAAAEQAS